MSEKIKDGGSAFPVMLQDIHSGEWMAITGMTLRDYFAAKAMQGFSASPDETFTGAPFVRIAIFAYEQADAMLAAREAKS